jgi:hypothetical protein
MMVQKKALIGAVVVLIVLLLVAAEHLASSLFEVSFVGRDVHGFHVTGVVVNDRDGSPVPSAHVIIQVGTAEFINSSKRCFGVIAGDDGKFSVQQDVPYAIRSTFTVAAAGPGNLYGVASATSPPSEGGRVVGEVIIRLISQSSAEMKRTRYEYDTFCDYCTPGKNLQFVGKGWEAREYNEYGQ